MDCDLPLSNAIALVPLLSMSFDHLPSVLHVYPPFKVEGFLIKLNLITSKAAAV